MSLFEFFQAPENFVARERILHMKSVLEMKTAAAAHGVQIQMTEPEIDNHGFDFTIFRGYDRLCIQNKATISGSRVSSWKAHPQHFQIPFLERQLWPEVDGLPIGSIEGAMGGLLIHRVSREAAEQNKLYVEYFYFDIFYASAVASGAYRSKKFSPQEARDILLKINKGDRGQRIVVPFKAMIPIKSPAALLSFRLDIPSPSNYVPIGRLPSHRVSGLEELFRAEIRDWLPQ